MTMNDHTDAPGPHRAPESLASIAAIGREGRHLAGILAGATGPTDPWIESGSSADGQLDLERWLDSDGFDFGPALHTVVPSPTWLFLTEPARPGAHHHVAAVGYSVTRHVWALTTCGQWYPIEQPVTVFDVDEGEIELRYVLKANLAVDITASGGQCRHPRIGERTA